MLYPLSYGRVYRTNVIIAQGCRRCNPLFEKIREGVIGCAGTARKGRSVPRSGTGLFILCAMSRRTVSSGLLSDGRTLRPESRFPPLKDGVPHRGGVKTYPPEW